MTNSADTTRDVVGRPVAAGLRPVAAGLRPVAAGAFPPIRILQLEDSADDAELIASQLRGSRVNFTAERVETRETFVRALREFQPDVVIADNRLPSFDGRLALHIVRETRPDLPVIVVSGTLDDEQAAELMRLGAADFVLKDRLARLGAAVGGAVERAAELRLRRAEEARFRALIENVSDVVATLDAQGVIRYISPSVTRVSGWAPEELVGQPFSRLLHPDERGPRQHAWPATLGVPGAFLATQYRYPHREGGWRTFEIITHNLLHMPEVASLVVVLRDITQRQAAEEVLRERASDKNRFDRLSFGREMRMAELKREVNAMAALAGRAPVYPLLEAAPERRARSRT